MRVAAAAWRLRETARRALLEDNNATAALAAARATVRLHDTERGRRLLVLALVANGRSMEALALAAMAAGREGPVAGSAHSNDASNSQTA